MYVCVCFNSKKGRESHELTPTQITSKAEQDYIFIIRYYINITFN